MVYLFGQIDSNRKIEKIYLQKLSSLKNIKITKETANAYYIERILIYSIQLKRIAMTEKDIVDSVKYVFELFGL